MSPPRTRRPSGSSRSSSAPRAGSPRTRSNAWSRMRRPRRGGPQVPRAGRCPHQADALIHAAEKSLGDLGEEVEEDERKSVEEAIESLKQAVQGDDRDAIEAGTIPSPNAQESLRKRAYRKAQAGGGAGGSWRRRRDPGRRRGRCGVRGSRPTRSSPLIPGVIARPARPAPAAVRPLLPRAGGGRPARGIGTGRG